VSGEELEALAARVATLRAKPIRHAANGAVDFVDASGAYVAVGLPPDIARAVEVPPAIVAELRRVRRADAT
jgi:hypothetical protein